MPLQEVRPGDLITADYINQLVQLLNALEVKVNSMGGSIPNVIVIERLVPPAPGPYKVGQRVEIIGENLGFLTSFMQIFIENKQVFEEPGGDDRKATIIIPSLDNLPDAGRRVKLLVRNRISQEEVDIDVQPTPIVLGGDITIAWRSTDPAVITGGQQIDFEYTAHSEATRRAIYTLRSIVTTTGPAVPGSGGIVIRDSIIFLDKDKIPITNRQLELDVDTERDRVPPKTFYLRVPIFPPLANNTKFTLAVALEAEGKTWTSGAKEFTVGQAVEPPDATITFAFRRVIPTSASVQEGPNRVVQLALNGQATVIFEGTFTHAGTYDVILPADAISGWTIRRTPGTDERYIVTQQDLRDSNNAVSEQIGFVIRAPAAAVTPPPTIELGLQEQGNPLKQTTSIILRTQ